FRGSKADRVVRGAGRAIGGRRHANRCRGDPAPGGRRHRADLAAVEQRRHAGARRQLSRADRRARRVRRSGRRSGRRFTAPAEAATAATAAAPPDARWPRGRLDRGHVGRGHPPQRIAAAPSGPPLPGTSALHLGRPRRRPARFTRALTIMTSRRRRMTTGPTGDTDNAAGNGGGPTPTPPPPPAPAPSPAPAPVD